MLLGNAVGKSELSRSVCGHVSQKRLVFLAGHSVQEERRRKSANLILSNSICLPLMLRDRVCYNTAVALNKLPDPHSLLRLSALISLLLLSSLCLRYYLG